MVKPTRRRFSLAPRPRVFAGRRPRHAADQSLANCERSTANEPDCQTTPARPAGFESFDPPSGKKLVIQIPCFNEESSLPIALASLPKSVDGYDTIETLVLDDGSTDDTVAVARAFGVTHVLQLPHRGLAQTFMTGIRHARSLGAHTVVNFDADNQYSADDIVTVTAPIVAGVAGVVIGERPLRSIKRFSPLKRQLQLAGNTFLRWLTGTAVTDAASGFRAIRYDVADLVEIRSDYTYTIEMLLDFALAGVPITFVPVRVAARELRPSRLIRSNAQYLFRNSCTIVRTLARSRPTRRRAGVNPVPAASPAAGR